MPTTTPNVHPFWSPAEVEAAIAPALAQPNAGRVLCYPWSHPMTSALTFKKLRESAGIPAVGLAALLLHAVTSSAILRTRS